MHTVDNYMTLEDAIREFPEAYNKHLEREYLRKVMVLTPKEEVKQLRDEVFALQDIQRASLPRDSWMENLINYVFIDYPIEVRMKRMKQLTKPKLKAGAGFDLERAKMVPISRFLEVNRAGFAKCMKHNERTPSMKVYEEQNRFHCFSCGWDGSVIDLVMQLEGCDFTGAVKRLGV